MRAGGKRLTPVSGGFSSRKKTLRGLIIAASANEAYAKDGADHYTHHAPVLMLFHADRWGVAFEENAHLVCAHAMLAAHALGLGATILGMMPPIVDQSKDLRRRYGIPPDNKVLTSLILGHPKFRYRKSVKRELASVRFFGE
jgi:nitroreductase